MCVQQAGAAVDCPGEHGDQPDPEEGAAGRVQGQEVPAPRPQGQEDARHPEKTHQAPGEQEGPANVLESARAYIRLPSNSVGFFKIMRFCWPRRGKSCQMAIFQHFCRRPSGISQCYWLFQIVSVPEIIKGRLSPTTVDHW